LPTIAGMLPSSSLQSFAGRSGPQCPSPPSDGSVVSGKSGGGGSSAAGMVGAVGHSTSSGTLYLASNGSLVRQGREGRLEQPWTWPWSSKSCWKRSWTETSLVVTVDVVMEPRGVSR